MIIGFCGYCTYSVLADHGELKAFLGADIVMTVACFVFSVLKRNSSVYDAYWSVIPFFFVLMWCYLHHGSIGFFEYIALIGVSLWSWRLTLNWARGWQGFSHEDWRYKDLAEQTKAFYPLVNFFGIHLFPTLLVFGGMWPLFYLFEGSGGDGSFSLYLLGIASMLLGTYLEYTADNALAKFRKRPDPKQEDLLNKGIWGVVRNPNYLGELLFWLGCFLTARSYGAPWYTVAGFAAMLALFTFVSLPLKEKRMAKRRPEAFEAYKREVPMIMPWFKRRKREED